MKKVFIVFFVLLNFYGSIHWNFIEYFDLKYNQLSQFDSTGSVQTLKKFFWWYPYVIGLDQRYTMFSTIHRSYYEYQFYGAGENGEKYIYPIELQSERTFWERNLFDHKRGKLHLILWNSKFGREAYSQYLYRTYAADAPFEIKKLAIDWYWQGIYPLDKARELGSGLSEKKNLYMTEEYDIKN